jgi:hypothetical protein
MGTAINGLMAELYKALNGTIKITKGTVEVTNAPSQIYPCIVIGSQTKRKAPTLTTDGDNTTITFHIWDRDHTDVSVNEILDALEDTLSSTEIIVDGYSVTFMEVVLSEVLKDPDPLFRHGVMIARFILDKT